MHPHSQSNVSDTAPQGRATRGIPLGVVLVGVLVAQAAVIFLAMQFVHLF
ncbi:MAG: hypothetical protein HMLKMBBP_02895 [Planctomycetes bacterium]|nr:hypothetical protein [Planctomycetota bacterium]